MISLGLGLALTQLPSNNETIPSNVYTTEDGLNEYTDESGNPYTKETAP